jgi:hypothetical protein
MKFNEEELRIIYRALKEAKKLTEIHKRPSNADNLDNANYKMIMDKIEKVF